MQDNLVGYLLGALDAETQRDVEKYLEQEPTARQNLESLRRALAPLEADKDTLDPPAGLVMRTIGRVAEYRCRPQPEAPAPPSRVVSVGRPWWLRPDVLAAACLLIVAGGLGTIWIGNQRAEAKRMACAHDLEQFGFALENYASQHGGEYPHIQKGVPHLVAASYLPMLNDAGVLKQNQRFCSGQPDLSTEIPSMQELQDLQNKSPEEFTKRIQQMPACYAYSLGYNHNDKHYPPSRVPGRYNNAIVPVMSDPPAVSDNHAEPRGNSLNHNGQNVLFLDGHVQFLKRPYAAMRDDDHIFLNKEGKVGAGVNQWDSVLGWREDRP